MTLWERVGRSILRHEGGYVNNPNDPGGETKYGISKRSYPNVDIKNLTPEQALEIYHRDFWPRIPAHLPDPVRWFAFDCAVHHGPGQALMWLKSNHTVAELASIRLLFFASLSTWEHFGKGWVRRVAYLLQEINEWAQAHPLPANTVVLHGLVEHPITLRGNFVWRARSQKIDIRWVGPTEE